MITQLTLAVGFLLVAALVGAVASDRVRVPKVTAYLLVGLAIGPHVLGWLRAEHIDSLEPFNDMAMALVLFNLGCQFSLDRFRYLLRHLVPLSAGEQTACFVMVAIATGLATNSWTTGILLGVLALATAPATTVLVLKESQARGPVTDLCGGLVAFNNLTCIIAFELVYVGIQLAKGKLTGGASAHVGGLLSELIGAIFVGLIGGFIVSFLCGLIARKRWLVLLLGMIAMVLGLCEMLHVPFLLAFLAMGLFVANTSSVATEISKQLEQATTVLCVLFFVLHGTHLDLHAFVDAGVVGLLYILMRMAGKYIGTWAVAKRRHELPDVQSWLGLSLMAQAGVAIAISSTIVTRGMEGAREVQSIILGSVVFFEIVGPLLIRHAVIKAGEMPLGQAIHHTSSTPMEQLRSMRDRLLYALGHQSADEGTLSVSNVMVTDVPALSNSAGFAKVIDYIEHSHDNVFPVVDAVGSTVGVIRYAAISGAVFEPDAMDLICADDLVEPITHWVAPNDPASRAIELFNEAPDDCLVVMDPLMENKYCGLVRRSDVMTLLVRGSAFRSSPTGNYVPAQ